MRRYLRTGLTIPAVLLTIAGFTPRASAIMGMGDTTIIVDDLTDIWKWPRELEQWNQMISNARDQVDRADALLNRIGDPKAAMDLVIQDVTKLTAPLDSAIALKTREEVLATAEQYYHLDSAVVKLYDDAKRIHLKYKAFGQDVQRNENRYLKYAAHEALRVRYEEAVKNAAKVTKAETDVQKNALTNLKSADSETKVAGYNGQIAASQKRQELAQQLATQAKAELDAADGQMKVEDSKKAEADREWAEHVITVLKNRAQEAYDKQVNGGANSSGT